MSADDVEAPSWSVQIGSWELNRVPLIFRLHFTRLQQSSRTLIPIHTCRLVAILGLPELGQLPGEDLTVDEFLGVDLFLEELDDRLQGEVSKRGVIDVLRKGAATPGRTPTGRRNHGTFTHFISLRDPDIAK